MNPFQCIYCGAAEIEEITPRVGRCSFCNQKQAIKSYDAAKFNRATEIRIKEKDFVKAKKLFQEMIDDNADDYEAYWGSVLCTYGIEYVKDPATGTYKPTCHNTVERPIEDNADYVMAMKYADEENQEIYRIQGEIINNYQKRILEICANEEPYDIFISFKATDEDGRKTNDMAVARRLYNVFEDMGFNVFFSEETLKDKAGEEFEPYIYAALKSSKVMILVGSRLEYIESTWVRNEWRRFIQMSSRAPEKRIIGAFGEEISPREIPYELSAKQYLRYNDPDFEERIIANIRKLLLESTAKQSGAAPKEKVIFRTYNEWIKVAEQAMLEFRQEEAAEALSKAIEANPNKSRAYWLITLMEAGETEKSIVHRKINLETYPNYKLCIQNATEEERQYYEGINNRCRMSLGLQYKYNGEVKTHTDIIDEIVSKKADIDNRVNAYKSELSGISYNSWILTVIMVVLNIIAAIILFSISYASEDVDNALKDIIIKIGICFVIGIISGVLALNTTDDFEGGKLFGIIAGHAVIYIGSFIAWTLQIEKSEKEHAVDIKHVPIYFYAAIAIMLIVAFIHTMMNLNMIRKKTSINTSISNQVKKIRVMAEEIDRENQSIKEINDRYRNGLEEGLIPVTYVGVSRYDDLVQSYKFYRP